MPNTIFAVFALLLPAGLILIAGGTLKGRRPARSAVTGLGAVALAILAYWATGFAFHQGGIGLVSGLPGLEGLIWEWASPLNLEWGVLGLRGFFMLDAAATSAALALFLAYLPAVCVAVVLPSLSLRERMPGWMAALAALLIAALAYPMIANWFSGGGWLMHTGSTLNQGHGYVDVTGLSTAAYVGGLAALLGIMIFGRRLPPQSSGDLAEYPTAHIPVLAVLGAFLAVAGGMALVGANPTHSEVDLLVPRVAVNLLLAAAAGAFVPSLYTWFTAGSADSLMVARGAAAAVLAVSAATSMMPPWAALALGAATGLLVPLVTYLTRYVMRIEDPTSAIPVGLIGGLLGIITVGVVSDGRAGAGWNGIGLDAYLGVNGQGVTGLLPAPGFALDWPGQVHAQLTGLAAVTVATIILVGGLFSVLKVLLLLWDAIPAPEQDVLDEPADAREPDPMISAPVDRPPEGETPVPAGESTVNDVDAADDATLPSSAQVDSEPGLDDQSTRNEEERNEQPPSD